ncbi:hypothetical protein EDF61_106153 [Arthrobacter sp. JUb115]|nr:hypothetical protein EDF61_106153 [Arthrobacter sp. JUb115]
MGSSPAKQLSGRVLDDYLAFTSAPISRFSLTPQTLRQPTDGRVVRCLHWLRRNYGAYHS